MLPCPHCELDIEDAARAMFYETKDQQFELGCPWCSRAVSVRLCPDGELRAGGGE